MLILFLGGEVLENRLEISAIPYSHNISDTKFDLDRIIYDLDSKIDLLSSQADTLDYLISVASGILCGMLDILLVGEFRLEHGREIASDKGALWHNAPNRSRRIRAR